MKSDLSRRGFLKALGVGVGAAVGARLPGAGFVGEAHAATEPTTVVILHLVGGYNAIFSSADSLVGSFGVSPGNITRLGNGLAIDSGFANALTPLVRGRMATIGVRHGISNHAGAQSALWTHESRNAGLLLANAIGGTGTIKAAVVGGNLLPDAPSASIDGTSFQSVTDLQRTLEAFGGGTPSGDDPTRPLMVEGMAAASKMSANALTGSPGSLASLGDGYSTAITTLRAPVQTLNLAELRTAYALGGNTTTVRDFKSKLAAAELMIRSGTNVVSVFDPGWDTHGDPDGTKVRNKMSSYVLAPLGTFLDRMARDTSRNVVVAILGDFARSLPNSDHQPNLSATMIGKYVRQGTTGRTSNAVALPPGTPSVPGLWSCLAAAARAGANPFGTNPHASLIS